MVVCIIAASGSIAAEQRRNWLSTISSVRQQTNRLLIGLVRHHVLLRHVAVMAAEAEKNTANLFRTRRNAGGKYFHKRSVIAELECCAIQWAGVLSPQCVAPC